MSERLSTYRPAGMDRGALRLWGMIIVAAGMLGRGILQNRVLGMGTVTSQQLLELMQASGAAMNAATVALVLQALESMAVPIFVLLTLDGFRCTSSVKNYLLRVGGVAVLSEIPYHFALGDSILSGSRNPVFGLVLVIVMLYLFRSFAGTGGKNVLIKILVFVAAWFWAAMLGVEYGRSMVVIACVLWGFRSRHTMAMMMACAAALACSAGNPLFLFAPFGLLIGHFYNGEPGRETAVWFRYLLYPILLTLIGLVGTLLF